MRKRLRVISLNCFHFFGVSEESITIESLSSLSLFDKNKNTAKQILPLDADVYQLVVDSEIPLIKEFFVAYGKYRDFMSSSLINLYAGPGDRWVQDAGLEALCRECTNHILPGKLARNSKDSKT